MILAYHALFIINNNNSSYFYLNLNAKILAKSVKILIIN